MTPMLDQHMAADAAAGALQALSSVKRELQGDSSYGMPPNKLLKKDHLPPQTAATTSPYSAATSTPASMTPAVDNKTAMARKIRLEQNRKAARESRRRKKVMIEELQRSVIFFSRANGTLKQQNEELMRLLVQAQGEIAQIQDPKAATAAPTPAPPAVAAPPAPTATPEQPPVPTTTVMPGEFGQAEADAVAAQAEFETKGFPSSAARAAAHSVATPTPTATAPTPVAAATPATPTLPTMQPGATMQAMANFQQAAALAMQMAVKGLNKTVPGVNVNQLAPEPVTTGQSAHQAFMTEMTAMAMQQAAAAAAAGQMMQQQSQLPFLFPMFAAWSNNAANGDNGNNPER